MYFYILFLLTANQIGGNCQKKKKEHKTEDSMVQPEIYIIWKKEILYFTLWADTR